jgi:hypothetical protein
VRIIAAMFFVGHGLVHGIMWALPFSEEARADLPMDPSRSWLLGEVRETGLALALVVTVAFVVAAGAVLADAGWWPWAGILGAALSVLLLALFFSPWWAIGLVIDAAIVVVAVRTLQT